MACSGQSFVNLGQGSLGTESTKKAYELRERVSEREKFYIESHYHDNVTDDLEKARTVYELWAQVYPRDYMPHSNLATDYAFLGQYDKALEQASEALHLEANGLSYYKLAISYSLLNRLQEAQATAKEAQEKKLDPPSLRLLLYRVAYLQNDTREMAQQVAWSAGKPGMEDVFLGYEADTAAYTGHLESAREFSRQAVASARRAEAKEREARYEAGAAVREALFGNAVRARQRASQALSLSNYRSVQCWAAAALGLAGDAVRAQALADDLARRFPASTRVQFTCLPAIHAQVALDRSDASKAIEALQASAPYEFGALGGPSTLGFSSALYPVYLRGEAYLAAHQGTEAAVEFRKILDHRNIVLIQPTGALARLGLARAYAMQGDTAKAKAAYQDFLTLWKDADPDIPILIAAKSEYTKLQ